jgi:DNA-binding MarR family transcriptional regulator
MSIEPLAGERRSALPARRRNTVLAALEIFRALDIGITTNNIVTFLYLCENEGISVTELAALAGLNPATASRSIRSLAAVGARWSLPPHLGLIEVLGYGPSRNSKTLRLTPLGAEIRDRLNALIEQGVRVEF